MLGEISGVSTYIFELLCDKFMSFSHVQQIYQEFWNQENVTTIFRILVVIIESGWQSNAEVVRDLVSEAFGSLLTLFKLTLNESNVILNELIRSLLVSDWQSRLKYRPLSQIVEMFGADILFSNTGNIDIAVKACTSFCDRAIAQHSATFIAAIANSTTSCSSSNFNCGDFILKVVNAIATLSQYDESITRHFVTFGIPKLLKVQGAKLVELVVSTAINKRNNLKVADFLIIFSVCRMARASGLFELPPFQESSKDVEFFGLLKMALNHTDNDVSYRLKNNFEPYVLKANYSGLTTEFGQQLFGQPLFGQQIRNMLIF